MYCKWAVHPNWYQLTSILTKNARVRRAFWLEAAQLSEFVLC